MMRWLLALALLGCSAGAASADYVLIMINLTGTNTESGAGLLGGGGIGVPPGAGMAGMAGMRPGGMMGMGGAMPPGVQGPPPGFAMRGGPGFGMMGGPGMGMMGGPGFAMRGGPGFGMMGGPGMGMMGGPGMMQGSFFGMFGQGAPPSVDDNPRFVVAVVEVESADGGNYVKRFESGLRPVNFRTKWGLAHLRKQTPISKVVLLKQSDGKPLATVGRRFEERKTETFMGTPAPVQLVELADWSLEHGLVGRFPEVMDKLLELDKNHPAAVAYAQVQGALKRPAEPGEAGSWRARLVEGYKLDLPDGAHYAVIHNSSGPSSEEYKSALADLENTFRGYYYWWALRGIALPVPRERQVVVVTHEPSDFRRLHDLLAAGPVVVDGYFARREGLTVMSAKRLDEPYDALDKFSSNWWHRGFKPDQVLLGKNTVGVPRGSSPNDISDAQMLALLLKAMEAEGELATVSHDASRQIVYASGLLPRNVAAPEWVLFGLGSFFETPQQAPWPGVGAPSFYWLPLFKEMKGDSKGVRFESTPFDTLKMVVTDHYFRHLPPPGEADTPLRRAHDDAVRRARTAAWGMTYFLAKEKLDALQRYLEQMSKMPRDMELSEATLMECFARAVGALDASGKPDVARLKSIANQWYTFISNVTLESEQMRQEIRNSYEEMIARNLPPAAPPGAAPGNPLNPAGPGRPGAPGAGGGGRGPGGSQ
jgi:hypothetical protein